jgi:S-adenosylmethionine-diacylglycerol 3-amino-3-carboxypropyl transferase
LKQAGIKSLQWDDFFDLFGRGHVSQAKQIYQGALRNHLTGESRDYWDKHFQKFFGSRRQPFYFRGTSGAFAKMINMYINKVIRVRPHIEAILEASSVDEQRDIYEAHLRQRFWSKPMCFAINRDTTLSLVGVPKAQRRQVEKDYDGGIVKFVQDCVESVFACLPLSDNYFWRVYLTGQYTEKCCPEYLKEENFEKLKAGLVDRVSTHTMSVQAFLDQHEGHISRYVLLDHMDWLSDKYFPLLEAEWQSILDRAAPGARVLWRSGGLKTDFVDNVQVNVNGKLTRLPELLTYNTDLAAELHEQDRVHTYGSFYIADLAA